MPEKEYVDLLVDDFVRERARLDDDNQLVSIFIGGGTPSLFSGDSYRYLLSRIEEQIPFSQDIEITLEANPGTAETDRFAAYYDAGINRLSLGIQSFDDQCLDRLGRIHNSDEALSAIAIAKQVGFENFNLDLMHGLPGQSSEQAVKDLQIGISSEPTHISWYQLTIEPNTVFYHRPPTLPIEKALEEIQTSGHGLLEGKDFHQYEVSAYAMSNRESIHNLNYWSFGDYLGIGAGAHGKLTLPAENRIIRTRKVKQPNHYLSTLNGRDAEIKEIPIQERSMEFLMNTLRLKEGFNQSQFESRTGLAFEEITKRVESQIEKGLMQIVEVDDEINISATSNGYRFLNSVLEGFL